MISKELNLKKKDRYYLGAIILISAILTIYYINFSMDFGLFCSDVYVYLVNSLYYSGENINAEKDLWLAPLICILTSLLFDLGLKSELSIFIVTGIFAVIGNIGLYFLFRMKFNKTLSFLGVVIYATFSLNLIWLANGSLDIPAVSLTIWTVLFALIAMDKNPKYYTWTILMFLLAFLIRYTVILIIPPLLLYFIYRKKYKSNWSELRYLILPLTAILIIAGVAIAILYIFTGDVQFITVGLDFIMVSSPNKADPAYNPNTYFYVQNFFNFLSSSNVSFYHNNPQLNYPTIISGIYGAILLVGGIIALKDNRNEKISKKYLALTTIFALLTIIAFIRLTSTLNICLMLITMLFARKVFKNSKFDLNLMLVSWLLIYLIFFSHVSFKVNRYFIPSLPVVAYFIIYGLCKIQKTIKINKYIIPIILTIVLLITAFNFTNEVNQTDHYIAPGKMSEYIINEIPDYKEKNIGSNTIRPYKWYLEKPIFGVRTSDLYLLNDDNITYYICNNKLDNLDNYTEIKNIDGIYLYQKNIK